MEDAKKTKKQLIEELRNLRSRNEKQEELEEALRENEERFRKLTDAAEEGIAIHDKGVIVEANGALAKMFGYELSELIGKNAEKLATPETWKIITKNIETGYDQPYEGIGVRKDGSTFHCQLVGKPFLYKGKTHRVATFRDVTTQKQTEEALRESEEKFRVLSEESPNMIFINQMGRIVYVNKKCEEIMGYTKEEFYDPNFNYFCLIAPEFLEMTKKGFEEHKAGRKFESYEYALLTKQGNRLNAIISTKLITYGNEIAILGLVTDITERKKAESQIRLLSTVVEQSTEGIAVCDLEGKLFYVNKAFANAHGYNPDELIGKNLSIFHTPEQMPAVQEVNRRIRENGEFSGEIWHVRRDGSVFPGLMHNSILRDQAGQPAGMIGTLRDITKRKKIEEALLESERKFRNLSEDIADGVVIAIDSKNYWVNKAFSEIFGYSKEELLGKGIDFLLVPEEVPEIMKRTKDRLAGKEVPDRYETIAKRKDGSRITVEVYAKLTVFDNKKAVQLVVRDITKRKQAEEQLQQYSETLEQMVEERTARVKELEKQHIESEKLAATGRMAARIAHEINNPLAGIKNSFLLVKDAIPKDHTYHKYVDRIEREIERIVRIVRQMFYLYKPDQETTKEFLLQETLDDIIALLEPARNEYAVSVNVHAGEKAASVAIPENLFRQILYNVLVNAIEASPPGGVVEISAEIKKNILKLTVTDQGHGISEDVQTRIFEPFFTTKSHLTKAGLGLGLSVTKSLVEAMKGKIDFTSTEGKGTVFRIDLPLDTMTKEVSDD